MAESKKPSVNAPETMTLANNILPLHPFMKQQGKAASAEEEGFAGPHHPLREMEEALSLPDEFDRSLHAWTGKMTTGMSPASVALAYMDWGLHLAAYPGRQQELLNDAVAKAVNFLGYATRRMSGQDCDACIAPEEKDDRFEDESWQDMPFSLYAQGFLLAQDWWQQATDNLHGVSRHHSDMVSFMTRQWLDMMSPANSPFTNPEVIRRTREEKGQNLVRGFEHFTEDVKRFYQNELPRGAEDYKPGRDLATCEGKVVYRNHLMELIQYSPQSKTVHPEPVLITPAWIMKYYILDLSPENSMVKYLLEKGHTVFMISWKNPNREDAKLGMQDYLKDGVIQAMDAVSDIVPNQKIQGVGYCIGGTLMSMAAAYMKKQKDHRLKSLTLFTTQVDFEEAGELLMFIDESQLAYLEDLMWEQGYLEKWQLSGAFNMLRSKDLIWSRVVREYLKGEDEQMFDLLAWNADATRLPYRMHSEYLRKLYLNNDLAEHRYEIDGTRIDLGDIDVPVFAVATQKDHIAPWKSVFKLHELLHTELTFTLTNGGHNAGIVSEPGHKGRKFHHLTSKANQSYRSPAQWKKDAEEQEGSWWPTWQRWLHDHSGERTQPPRMGAPDKGYTPQEEAPGTYVYAR